MAYRFDICLVHVEADVIAVVMLKATRAQLIKKCACRKKNACSPYLART